jgi:hypothetical protein
MMSFGPNPLSLQRCLPSRAQSTCARTVSDAAATPIETSDGLSESPSLRLLTGLSLRPDPFSGIHNHTRPTPQPQTTSRQTDQHPLKIDLPAKV